MSSQPDFYRLLFETASEAILVMRNGQTDAAWTVVDGNASAETLFDCSREKLLGQTLLDFSPLTQPDGTDSGLVWQEKVEAVCSGQQQSFEWQLQRLNGDPFYVQVALNCLSYDQEVLIQAVIHDITARKQTEEQLHKLSRAVEQSGNTIVITDTQGHIEYVNLKFTETTGYSREEAIGQHTRILKSGTTPSEGYKELWETITAGKEWRGEFHNKNKYGKLYWEFISISPVKDEQGRIISFIAVKEESTARKQAEEALRLSEARYRELVHSTNSIVLQFDSQGYVTFINEFAQEFFGYTAKEILGRNVIGTIVPETESSGRDLTMMIQDLLQHPEQYEANENENIRRSGERVWVSWANKALFNEAGELTEILCIGQDITERKRLEQALQESEQRLADIINFLPYPTFAIDKEGKIIVWNRASENALGVKAKEILGKGDYEYALPFYGERRPILIDLIFAPPEEIEQKYVNIRRDGETLRGEAYIYPQGQPRYFVGTAAPLYDARGEIVGAIETFRDITEQKQAEAELRQYQDQLEELVEARTVELEERLNELHTLQRLMGRGAWQEFQAMRQQIVAGYLFDQKTVRSITQDELELPGHKLADVAEATALTADHQLVVTPLTVSGESIGSLGIYADPDQPLAPEDQDFLDEVAAQVAEALERARLLEQSQSSLAATETLYQASRRITEARNLQEIVAAVMEVSSISAIKRAVLFALELDSVGDVESMTVVANWFSGEGTEPTAIGTRFSKTAVLAETNLFLTPEPLFFGDVQHDDRIDPAGKLILQQRNIRAMAIVPLWIGSRHLGSLTLEAEETYKFSEQDMRLIRSLADQAAVAIDNQRLLEESQAALAEVQATQRRYTIQSWDDYRARQAVNVYQQAREGVPPLNGDLPPETKQAVSQKKPVTILSTSARPDQIDDVSTAAADAKSSLIVPLTVRNAVIGVLGLQEIDDRAWLPEEIALVEAIAEQVAQAAEQIRLLEESQQRAARERRVNEIGDKIRSAQSLEEALRVAIKEVGLSLKAPQTLVQLDVK